MSWTHLHRSASALAIVLLAVGLWSSIRTAVDVHANSDLFFIASVHQDLFENGRGISGWNLPPAPYFFPDAILLFSAFELTGSLIGGYLLYGVLLYALLLGGAFALYRSLGAEPASAAVATLLSGLAFLAVMQGAHPSLLVSFLPIFHAGAAVVGVYVVVLIGQALRRGYTPGLCALILALSVGIALSDLFSVFQIFLPVALTTLVMSRREDVSRTFVTVTYALIAASMVCVVLVLGIAGSVWHLSFLGNPVFAKLAQGLDPLILLGSVVLAAAAVLIARFIRLWHALAALGAVLAALGILLVLNPDYMSRRAHTLAVPEGWPMSSVTLFAKDLLVLAGHDPVLFLAMVLAPVLCIVALRRLSEWPANASDAKGGAISKEDVQSRTFLAIAFLFIVGIAIIAGGLEWIGLGFPVFDGLEIYREGTIRHIQPIYVYPIFVLMALLLARRRIPPERLQTAAIAVLLVYALVRIGPTINEALRPPHLPYPAYQECLDELARDRGLEAGYGDYWTARTLAFLSHAGIEMMALREPMVPDFWVHNMEGFLPPPGDPRAYPRYDFVVPSRFGPEAFAARFGEPAARGLCGALDVMVYDRPEDLAFRSFQRLPVLLGAGRPLPSEALGPAALSSYVAEGTPAGEADALALEAGAPLEVELKAPVAGDVLELAYAGSDPVSVVPIDADGHAHAALELPANAAATMHIAYRRLPGAGHTRWRGFRIESAGTLQLGHLFVYRDSRTRGE